MSTDDTPRSGHHFKKPAPDGAGVAGAQNAGATSGSGFTPSGASPSDTSVFTAAYMKSRQQGFGSVPPAAESYDADGSSAASADSPADGSSFADEPLPPLDGGQVAYSADATGPVEWQTFAPAGGGDGADGSYYKKKRRRRPRYGRRIAAVVGILFAVILVAGGVCGFTLLGDAKTLMNAVPAVIEEAKGIQDAMQSGDGSSLRATAESISSKVGDMKKTTDGFAWQVASFFPVLGQDVSSARTMVFELDTLCRDALIPASEGLSDVSLDNLMSDGAFNVELLQRLVDTLSEVSPVVARGAERIQALPEAHIGKLNDAFAKVQGLVGAADDAVSQANQIAPYLPQMLGADGQTRNYLIVAQTNAEMRSTGGLPGSMGIMSVTDGRISLGEFSGLGALKQYDAPAFDTTKEEATLFTGFGTVPSASTLNPDFSRAGRLLGQMWQDQKGIVVNGVLAFDPIFLQNLLKLTGGITAANGTEVNGENAAALLLNSVYRTMPVDETDAFFSEVADAAFNKVIGSLGDVDIAQLGETLGDAVDARHLQVYMADADEEQAMVKMGCAGLIPSDATAPEVGIYINDITWSKIAWYLSVDSTVSDGVKNADGTTTYHVSLVYRNNMAPEEAEGLPNYITGGNPGKRERSDMMCSTFFFAPEGGSITNMSNTDDEGNSVSVPEVTYNGRKGYQNIVNIRAGRSATYEFDVTVSAEATEPLGIDMTPLAQEAAGWK